MVGIDRQARSLLSAGRRKVMEQGNLQRRYIKVIVRSLTRVNGNF